MHENTYNISMTKHQIRLLKALNFSTLYNYSNDLDKLREYKRNKDWDNYLQLSRKYFPDILRKYLNSEYQITLTNGEKVTIPIKYSMEMKNDGKTQAEFYFNPNLTNYFIVFYPIIIAYSQEIVDSVLAHELTHAKRILSKISKMPLDNPKNRMHEEFWADRQFKKMLPTVHPKYTSRKERKNTLKISHKTFNRRKETGRWTKLGEFWDRLTPFSINNNQNNYYFYTREYLKYLYR